MMGAGFAHATNVPTSGDPSRTLSAPQTKSLTFKKAEPDERPKSVSVPNAPAGAESAFFTLKTIHFQGMTAYTEQQISRLYAADIGQNISVLRLFEILNAVQAKYLDDGFSLSRVTMPTQDIAAGDVVFQVIEGYAAEVEIDDPSNRDLVLENARNQIISMRPLNTKRLEKILLTLNDLPGLNVSAILGAIQSPNPSLGAVRLVLKRNPERTLSAGLGINNYGSIFNGPFQVVANAHKSSILSPYDDLAISLASAIPAVEMGYAGLKYQKPVENLLGANFIIDASIGRTAPGESLKELDITGQSRSLKVGFEYSVLHQRDHALKIHSDFEIRQAKTHLIDEVLYDDRLRILSIGASYNSADSFNGLNAFELTYSQGFNILEARQRGSINLSRNEGGPDFKKIYGSVGRLQSLPFKLDVLVALQGQYTSDPLLASEEFGFGGSQIGRGYDPSEITGDTGIAGTIEFRRNFSFENAMAAVQAYSFFDMGKVWNIDPNSKDKISAASTGMGVRTAFPNNISTDLNISIPLTLAAANPPPYANGKNARILFSIQKKF